MYLKTNFSLIGIFFYEVIVTYQGVLAAMILQMG